MNHNIYDYGVTPEELKLLYIEYSSKKVYLKTLHKKSTARFVRIIQDER